jgi:hypothetical protein
VVPLYNVHRTQMFNEHAGVPQGRHKDPGWLTFVIAIKLQVSLANYRQEYNEITCLQCVVYEHVSCPYLQTVNYQLKNVLKSCRQYVLQWQLVICLPYPECE